MITKAFLFAAGRGERMGELTTATPKPLLQVGGKVLIEYVIEQLSYAGVKQLIVNLAYRGEQIESMLVTGEQFGVSIQ
jgi:MurNAc alpha-1-phosphate uridylyltransferase